MLASDRFQITQIRVGFFTGLGPFPTARILGSLLQEWHEVFNGEPVTVPVPEGEMPDVPRVLLRSTDGRHSLHLAPVRIDVVRSQVVWDEEVKINDQVDLAVKVCRTYLNIIGAPVNRVALLLTRASLMPEPGLALAKHFCKEKWLRGPLNRPENFELHAHKAYEFRTIPLNSWVRCKTGSIRTSSPEISPAVRQSGVIVEQDLNTAPLEEPDARIELAQVEEFLRHVAGEATLILAKYFPSTENN